MKFSTLYRQLPSFKGKMTLGNCLFDRKAKDVLVTTKSGKFRLPNLEDGQYFELFCRGSYEPALVKYIVDTLPKNGCLLDVGGNIGSITIPVALARPDARIITIEALPRNFKFLDTNIKLNGLTNVTPMNVCFSDTDGKVMKFYHHETKVGSSSFHSLHSQDYVELVTKTLDQQLNELSVAKVDMLKIDTEGSEALIFQGASNLIQKSKPIILFEFSEFYENAIDGLHAGDAQQILIDAGYKIFDFDDYQANKPFSEILRKGFGEFLAIPC